MHLNMRSICNLWSYVDVDVEEIRESLLEIRDVVESGGVGDDVVCVSSRALLQA